MKVDKKVIAELNLCYAIGLLNSGGQRSFVVATEKEGECQRFDLEGNYLETVWTEPGGIMTMIQVPGGNGAFLATHKFYSPNNSAEAYLVQAVPVDATGKPVKDLTEDHTWRVIRLCDMPFVHRFGIIKSGEKSYIIACTLKSDHEYKEDWRFPGKVLVCELPDNLLDYDADQGKPLEFTVIKEGLTRNHGFTITNYKGLQVCFIATENGIFRITPPEKDRADWQIDRILDMASSDLRIIDLDQDGRLEYLVFAPFHGENLYIYRETDKGLERIYDHEPKLPFLHALWAGELSGKPCFLAGNRREDQDLYLVTWDKEKGGIVFETVDKGRGPTNVDVYSNQGEDYIISANRETNEVALYKIKLD